MRELSTLTESGAGCPLSIIESEGIFVAGAGVSHAQKTSEKTITAKKKLFITLEFS